MITGNIKDFEKYVCIHPDFKKAYEFMQECMNNENASVETDTVRGSVSEKETSTAFEGCDTIRLEAHRKYIDIHFIISGEEKFGYAHIDRLTPECEYNDEKDFQFLTGKADYVILSGGDFIVTFPEDAHAPSLRSDGADRVKRTVIKIKI